MKQYFMKGVDEPLEFGDTLGFDLVKKGDEGQSVTKHVECTFIPEIVPLLLEEDVIEEKEVKDKPESIDFSDDDNTEEDDVEVWEAINEIDGDIDELTDLEEDTRKRLAELEKRVNNLERKNFISSNDKKPFSNEFTTIEDYFKRNKDIFKPSNTWKPNVEIFGFAF